MAEQSGGEKTLPASGQKRQKAREEGRVARSQDLNSAIAMLAALVTLLYLGPGIFSRLEAIVEHFFENADLLKPSPETFQSLSAESVWLMAPTVVPFMGIMMIIGVAVNLLQVGFLFTTKPLTPKFDKLNFFAGFGSMFSLRTFVELIKSLLKVSVASYIVWLTVQGRMDEIIGLMNATPYSATVAVAGLIFTIWWRIALAMLVLGILDYGFQKWQHERDLMMTFQEAKEEMREFEGDPRIKQRVRQIQRQMAMQRMMHEVPGADVIVTNPTTYAVALKYDTATMAAPTVVAKGARLLAERIRDLAIENDVPIVQKPELARSMYQNIEVGQAVPEDLFRAVAEVLAYVYQIDRRADKVRQRNQTWKRSVA